VGTVGAQKIVRVLDRALTHKLPVIALMDSDGARIVEGLDAVTANSDVLSRTVALQGVVPQLSLVCGLCVGSAAYAAALGDVTGMIQGQSFMFVTGPRVTQIATGEDVDIEALGGTHVHASMTGACHAVLENEAAGIAWLQRVLGHLSSSPTVVEPRDRATLASLVPDDPRKPYDMRAVVRALVDDDSALELAAAYAPNLLTMLARMNGRAVALVASQPRHLGGVLDVNASRKGARFVTMAASWGLPILTLVDVPGYMPGVQQERAGILPIGAELLTAYGRARVPKVSLVVRKSIGGGNVLTSSADVRLALPTARVAPMGVDAAVEVELGPARDDATDDDKRVRVAVREQWLARWDSVWAAADKGFIDQVVDAGEARAVIARTLARLAGGARD
jgi:propionyl-CoA carboxylase beta chain